MKPPKAKAFELLIALAKRRSPDAKQDQQRFARCATEFISLISVKETNQRRRCLSKANPGSHRRGDFSTGHPCPIEKRRTSCAAPSGSAIDTGDCLSSEAEKPKSWTVRPAGRTAARRQPPRL